MHEDSLRYSKGVTVLYTNYPSAPNGAVGVHPVAMDKAVL